MQVFKIEKPILAFALLAVADGNNFEELSAEVSAEVGGSVELINDELARVVVSGRTYYRDWETDRKSTRLNSSHSAKSRMPSSA